MRKLWMTTAVLSLCALAGAQQIGPTTNTEDDDQVNVGGRSASVQQTVNLKLPEATALHLDVKDLVFDISQIGAQDSSWYCAYGIDQDGDGLAQDVAYDTSGDGDEFWGQTVVLPLGTSYDPVDGEFGKINIIAGDRATSYPAVNRDGKDVQNKDKAYFVCYRSFLLQKFSNVGHFKLSVTRDTPGGDRGKQLMYIQDNPCDRWNDPTGLYNLPPGATRELIPLSMTVGTTGQRAASASTGAERVPPPRTPLCRPYTSWLDDLVVVAVVVDGDLAGDNVATLTYTLESKDAPFQLADSDATPYGNP